MEYLILLNAQKCEEEGRKILRRGGMERKADSMIRRKRELNIGARCSVLY